ncbi:hypothetical protein GALMADRAFT_213408 [Galerina marginata CBS 339.88]|uniref:Uncharacterized protein n=1 Tax=Galerina marginata (strain CBS 339.88) TaxID=685588 RepID=A0A067SR18_GALM3|nr:hypothetical protein GALMADRAFT_213408 [Galerina marginata CBS 339.88]
MAWLRILKAEAAWGILAVDGECRWTAKTAKELAGFWEEKSVSEGGDGAENTIEIEERKNVHLSGGDLPWKSSFHSVASPATGLTSPTISPSPPVALDKRAPHSPGGLISDWA